MENNHYRSPEGSTIPLEVASMRQLVTALQEDVEEIKLDVKMLVRSEYERQGAFKMGRLVFGVFALLAGLIGGGLAHVLSRLF